MPINTNLNANNNQDVEQMKQTALQTSFVYTKLYEISETDKPRGSLANWPISIKDNLDVAGERTMAGSLICQADSPAQKDAPVVQRLREAGAVITGKTSMTEFAFSGVGINPHYGTPANPCDSEVQRIPGGSSAGAAVSVAAGLVRAAIGTDTGGSVRIPAALCGLVGFKGTQARIPREGVLELSRSLDTVGVIARSVQDVLAVDAVISEHALPTTSCRLEGVRLAIPTTLFFDSVEDTVMKSFDHGIDLLIKMGASVERIAFDCVNEIATRSKPSGLSPVECWRAHQHRFDRAPERIDPRVLARVNLGRNVSEDDYAGLQLRRREWIEIAKQAMDGFDALICPTVPIVAPAIQPLLESDERFFEVNRLLLRNPSMINYLDGCSWSLPLPTQGQLPVGLMLSSFAHQDERLAGIALAIEQAFEVDTEAHAA